MPLQMTVNLPYAAAQAADMSFNGRYEQSRDGLDCVAIFDGSTWRLELVQGLAKNMRGGTRCALETEGVVTAEV